MLCPHYQIRDAPGLESLSMEYGVRSELGNADDSHLFMKSVIHGRFMMSVRWCPVVAQNL